MKKQYKSKIAVILATLVMTACVPMEKPRPENALPKHEQIQTLSPKTSEHIEKEEKSETQDKTEVSSEKPKAKESKVVTETKDKVKENTEPEPEKDIKEKVDSENQSEGNVENKNPVKNTLPEIVNQFSNQAEYDLEIDIDTLSQEPQSWGFKRNKEHTPVTAYYKADLPKYGTYYLGNTNEKVVYLTFDEGYENGFSPSILDTLKEKQVKAAFFITGSYLKHNPDLVKRMRSEGHVVANHSQTHPDFTTKTDEEVMAEVSQVGDKFKELTDTEMDPFFRFPSGRYTERDLYIIRKMGYRNIFWSMAYKDWEVDNQPGKEYARTHVLENYHPGAIILLHAVSSSNTEALADIITELDAAGYRFGSLYELE